MSPKHRKPHILWDSPGDDRTQPEICPTTGKRKHASEAEAQATARHQMAQQKDTASLQLRTYRCLYCDSWHLTSKGDK